ncbi:MAG TPA: phosphatase PAP2 family protein [Pseudacidobacterium sp.]|jgi:membrane-associated phospholipid phosphatase|nr:phosphatase PAP2 family protein [Pseudacidobacterium sp.]
MRPSEWIQAGFATILAVAAWIRPLTAHRRFVVALLAAFAIFAVMLARLSARILPPFQVSIFRDWLPVVLMLVPYWQTGQFFMGPNEKIQSRLAEIDRWLLNLIPVKTWTLGRYTRLTLEWAYMFCYPQVPLGLAVLYAAGLRQYASTYWFIVLVPTYFCYAITPFVPALPPRSIIKQQQTRATSSKSRVMNLWILEYGSIQAISFPSAHVASALAISFVLLRFVPIAGVIFLIVSFWISVAAVVGGYHYAIDVLLGAIVALLVGAAWLAHLIPSNLITAPAIALVAGF